MEPRNQKQSQVTHSQNYQDTKGIQSDVIIDGGSMVIRSDIGQSPRIITEWLETGPDAFPSRFRCNLSFLRRPKSVKSPLLSPGSGTHYVALSRHIPAPSEKLCTQ